MRRAGPSPEANHFQRDGPVEAFLTRAINDPLSAATNFLEQFVIAELHLDSARPLLAVAGVLERCQTSFEQTHAAKSAWRVGKNGRAAFCANALNFVDFGTQ